MNEKKLHYDNLKRLEKAKKAKQKTKIEPQMKF